MKTTVQCPTDDLNIVIDWETDEQVDTYYVVNIEAECEHQFTWQQAYDMLLDYGCRQSELQMEHAWER